MRPTAPARISISLTSALLLLGAACQATPTYDISGRVAGLAGTGLVLRSGVSADLPVATNGPVQFAGSWEEGTAFALTVVAQPTGPSQTCTVVTAHASVQAADELFAVTCVTDAFALGGNVSGLAGHGLVLQNAGVDPLPVEATGAFGFGRPVASGAAYDVVVRSQPTGPSQTCVVSGGAGTVVAGAVSTVSVNCSTDRAVVGGTVSGLKGTGLLLQDAGAGDLAVNANGAFAFAAPRASGTAYDVTVAAQPTGPAQTCRVASGSGLVAGTPVTAPVVTCATNRYAVGGTVSGLGGAGLELRLNGGQDLPVAADGSFQFPGTLEAGQAWEVAVAVQPSSPAQACTVAGGSGVVVAGDVRSVAVQCATRSFAVGGNVTNLSGTGLVLQQAGAGDLAIDARGGFAFAAPLASGAAYDVTVKTQPTNPWQTCGVTAGSGTVAGAPVADVVVTCVTDSFAVGGTVAGLFNPTRVAGVMDLRFRFGMVLGSGGDVVYVSVDGPFELPPVASGSSYAVTVVTPPEWPSQACSVADGTGVVAGTAVTNVVVSCTTNQFTVGGTATGMPPAGLELANGADLLRLDFDGPWAFPTPVASGASYDVQLVSQPPTLLCSIAQGSGLVGPEAVTSVEVTCGCSTGLADCDGNPGNGCEQDVATSSAHCGACGLACAGGETCQAGACVAAGPF